MFCTHGEFDRARLVGIQIMSRLHCSNADSVDNNVRLAITYRGFLKKFQTAKGVRLASQPLFDSHI